MRARISKRITLLAVVSVFTTACTTINPYTGEEQTSRAVQYGAIGSVVCGLIGAVESGQRARNAAAGCGAIGIGIGAYMDVQEAELREELQGTGVQVQRNGDRLNLIMPGNITFATNEYAIKSEFYPALGSVARVLSKYEDTNLQVFGHTDSTGDAAYNYELSRQRANSVNNYLASQGVDQSRILSQGVGSDQPIANNDTASGRAMNRRVELQVFAVES
ncbi:MAG: cell envelope biogenesis protein OmpA [Pseudohongiella sp.]|nr:MAG: cell envelope biogenesis protein OmpA [Pseudohongiella sp.]